jgi:hypothetical protein
MVYSLRQPGQPHYQPPKSMVLNLFQLIKSCYTRTDPAAKPKSIGLPADAQLSAFFALPLIKFTLTKDFLTINRDSYAREFHLDKKPYIRLPGLSHQDNFIVT